MSAGIAIAAVCWVLSTLGLVAGRILFPDVQSGIAATMLLGWLLWSGCFAVLVYRAQQRRRTL